MTVILGKFKSKRRTLAKRPRYHFPREVLEQDQFTLLGNGNRIVASLAIGMLSSEKFDSPLAALLSQLSNDGCDVTACEAEFRAMREIVCNIGRDLEGVEGISRRLLLKPTSPCWEYLEQLQEKYDHQP